MMTIQKSRIIPKVSSDFTIFGCYLRIILIGAYPLLHDSQKVRVLMLSDRAQSVPHGTVRAAEA